MSNKSDKTLVVKVSEFNPHPKYHKIIETTKNYMVHTDSNDCSIGDQVKIEETKPMSKNKRWRMIEVLKKAT